MGKLIEGDVVEIIVDRNTMEGLVNLVGHGNHIYDAAWGTRELASRPIRTDLAEDPLLPADSRLWAALQDVSGGTWGGCVYDVDSILRVIAAGKRALASEASPVTAELTTTESR